MRPPHPAPVRPRRRQCRAAVRHGRADARLPRWRIKAGLEPAPTPQPGRATRCSPTWISPGTRRGWAIAQRPGTAAGHGRARRCWPMSSPTATRSNRSPRRCATGALPTPASSTAVDAETRRTQLSQAAQARAAVRHAARPGQTGAVERAAYDAAYKGVTDALTLYLWRQPAFLPDPLGGAGRPHPQYGHADRRGALRRWPSSCSGTATIGSGSPPASSSWCSTPSTESSRAAPAPRPNGAMSSTMASTSSTRPSGGGRGRMGLPPIATRRRDRAGLRAMLVWGDRRRLCRPAR